MRRSVLAFLVIPLACATTNSGGPGSVDTDAGPGAAADANASANETGSPAGSDSGTSTDTGSTGEAGSGDSSPSTDCSSLPLCDDFESDTPGAPPSATLWTVLMGCNPNTTNAPVDGGLTVGVDNSASHSGKNSVRVVGGDSCGYYFVNTSAFGKLGPQVYARVYARFSGPPTMGHNGFLSMYSGTATNFLSMYSNSEQLRLGFQGGVIVWNYLSSDATLPDIDTMGEAQSVATQTNQWDCVEFHLDQTTGHIEFWLNGTVVSGLSYDGTSTQGVSDNWHSGGPTSLMLKSFGLGWLGLNNQYTTWFDDVALANSRIQCH